MGINKYLVQILIICLLLTCLIGTSSCKKKHKETVTMDNFACWAERLRVPTDTNDSSETIHRRKQAFDMLSNSILDDRVIILGATVKQNSLSSGAPRSVRNTPTLVIFVVDECNRLGFINYSESDDPNAFGDTIFGLNDHRLLFGTWSSYDSYPVYYWSLYLKGYDDIHDFELLKNQYEWYSSWAILEVSQPKFDSLVANRGQIILYDRKFKVLDRFALRSPDQNEQF